MTNRQAFNLANICGMMTNSKQLSFGVIRRLAKNAKVIESLTKEAQEIKKLGDEKEKEEEEILKELEAFENEDFKGQFEEISLDLVFDIKSEQISQGDRKLDLNAGLLILDEYNLLK